MTKDTEPEQTPAEPTETDSGETTTNDTEPEQTPAEPTETDSGETTANN